MYQQIIFALNQFKSLIFKLILAIVILNLTISFFFLLPVINNSNELNYYNDLAGPDLIATYSGDAQIWNVTESIQLEINNSDYWLNIFSDIYSFGNVSTQGHQISDIIFSMKVLSGPFYQDSNYTYPYHFSLDNDSNFIERSYSNLVVVQDKYFQQLIQSFNLPNAQTNKAVYLHNIEYPHYIKNNSFYFRSGPDLLIQFSNDFIIKTPYPETFSSINYQNIIRMPQVLVINPNLPAVITTYSNFLNILNSEIPLLIEDFSIEIHYQFPITDYNDYIYIKENSGLKSNLIVFETIQYYSANSSIPIFAENNDFFNFNNRILDLTLFKKNLLEDLVTYSNSLFNVMLIYSLSLGILLFYFLIKPFSEFSEFTSYQKYQESIGNSLRTIQLERIALISITIFIGSLISTFFIQILHSWYKIVGSLIPSLIFSLLFPFSLFLYNELKNTLFSLQKTEKLAKNSESNTESQKLTLFFLVLLILDIILVFIYNFPFILKISDIPIILFFYTLFFVLIPLILLYNVFINKTTILSTILDFIGFQLSRIYNKKAFSIYFNSLLRIRGLFNIKVTILLLFIIGILIPQFVFIFNQSQIIYEHELEVGGDLSVNIPVTEVVNNYDLFENELLKYDLIFTPFWHFSGQFLSNFDNKNTGILFSEILALNLSLLNELNERTNFVRTDYRPDNTTNGIYISDNLKKTSFVTTDYSHKKLELASYAGFDTISDPIDYIYMGSYNSFYKLSVNYIGLISSFIVDFNFLYQHYSDNALIVNTILDSGFMIWSNNYTEKEQISEFFTSLGYSVSLKNEISYERFIQIEIYNQISQLLSLLMLLGLVLIGFIITEDYSTIFIPNMRGLFYQKYSVNFVQNLSFLFLSLFSTIVLIFGVILSFIISFGFYYLSSFQVPTVLPLWLIQINFFSTNQFVYVIIVFLILNFGFYINLYKNRKIFVNIYTDN